ncbi:MAG: 4Fe-4S single cluster domain of Ferredoxin [Acidobacteria bacterium]|nr:4Fe-4S single cluster domain of Ferredoxin [Acidobacteriota bacterium]
MAYRCNIDRKCINCNVCVDAAPGCFARENGRVVVRHNAVSMSLLGDVREAAAACPTGALSLIRSRSARETRLR